ncbi:protein ydcF [Klebsiella aerogenes]|nr:protein ydcF [Klebsiella aerogenes]
MAEQFPPLSAATLAAANQVGAWLAQDDLATLPVLPQVDVVVLAGNAVIPTIDAACRLAAAQAVPLLISGGVGHSTGYLYEAVRQDPRYRRLPVDGRPEAHVLADIAHDYWHIPIRGWWWRTSQPTAVRTPVLPGPRWRAGGSPIVAGSSFRTRLCSGEPWLPSPASGRGRRRRRSG